MHLRDVDWFNLESVTKFCQQLGPDSIVTKHPNRPNFNITHRSRLDLYLPEWVVYPKAPQTPQDRS